MVHECTLWVLVPCNIVNSIRPVVVSSEHNVSNKLLSCLFLKVLLVVRVQLVAKGESSTSTSEYISAR